MCVPKGITSLYTWAPAQLGNEHTGENKIKGGASPSPRRQAGPLSLSPCLLCVLYVEPKNKTVGRERESARTRAYTHGRRPYGPALLPISAAAAEPAVKVWLGRSVDTSSSEDCLMYTTPPPHVCVPQQPASQPAPFPPPPLSLYNYIQS
jgi:hypothetical protein